MTKGIEGITQLLKVVLNHQPSDLVKLLIERFWFLNFYYVNHLYAFKLKS